MKYSYAYQGPSTPSVQTKGPVRQFFAQAADFASRRRVRFLLIILVQSLIITASTGIYMATHAQEAGSEAYLPSAQKPAHSDSPQVLGASENTKPTPTQAPATPTPTPNIAQLLDKPSKPFYKIAVYGDSMVDTMGEVMEYLDDSLHKHYPDTKFILYNYGVGSENVAEGLDRFGKRFDYKSRHYLPITEIEPDIIIIGSFAYNPFTPHDRDRHWLTLTALVQEAQKTGAQVYMLAEIAPLRKDFGKGPQGVNWDEQTAYTHSGHIVEQLENAVGLAKTLKVSIFDAYTASLDPDSKIKEGKKELVNSDDGIHPSVKGHQFMSELIASEIVLP